MGSGLSGGPLTGNVTTAALPPAPAGQSAVLSGPLGAGATDVVTKIGSTVADGSVNNGAHLASFRTGIGGTEVEYAYFFKLGLQFVNLSTIKLGNIGFSGLDLDGSVNYNYSGGATRLTLNANSGIINQNGTDSTGTPGAATIDKPTGKSSIALGAASVTITCSLCAATSRVMITPHARDATCKELIVVPGAGSFVVSGSAAATADLPFSWQVSTIL